MPRRQKSNKDWPSESERMVITPAMKRHFHKSVTLDAQNMLERFALAEDQGKRFDKLPQAAMAAFHLKNYHQADQLARQALEAAESHKENWNYGNAIHYGHTVLGLLALRAGNTQAALAELRASGDTPGSPQLRSFGPMMQLAKELLERGRYPEVLEFIQQCRIFWTHGERWLFIWEKKILRGVVPNFVMNLNR